MKTITLCGSARFETEYKVCMRLLTMNGVTAIGLGDYPSDNDGEKEWYTPAVKEVLDLVHISKVSQADIILIVDCTFEPAFDVAASRDEPLSYVGFSTARELLWCALQDKPVAFLSDMIDGESIEEAMAALSQAVPHADAQTIELDVAVKLMGAALGREEVAKDQRETHFNVMHASLSGSVIATDAKSALDLRRDAAETLEFIGLGTMADQEREAYLNMVYGTVVQDRHVVGA